MTLTRSDLHRITEHPGLHGAHCSRCDRLFDAYDTPAPMDDVLMRLRKLCCPCCESRSHLFVLMPHAYRAKVLAQIEAEDRREAVRRVADRYIPR